MAFPSRRKLAPVAAEDAGELNIVPYLDIMMNLIMFMLLSMTGLGAFGVVNASVPRFRPDRAPQVGAPTPEPSALRLSVLVTAKGFYVAGEGGILPGERRGEPTIAARGDGSLDFAALTSRLAEVKQAFPTETKVVLVADPETPYETLVRTMDACRENPAKRVEGRPELLFYDVSLAAGVE